MSKDNYINISVHLLIWSLLTIILFLYPTLAYKGLELPADFTIKQVVHLCFMLIAYYLNAYWLVPRLLLKKRYLPFGFGIIILVFTSAYILAMVENGLELKAQMTHIWTKSPGTSYFDKFGFFTVLITLGISTSISVINKWNAENKERLSLEKERINTELTVLKAQIHPHFFFNTLNSIYALSYIDAEGSRKVLTRLSHIMRYLLYETHQNTVDLHKELSFISNYIEIMRSRLPADISLAVSMPDTIAPMSIAPMILISYVENVFKHGIDETDNNTLFIQIEQRLNGIRLKTLNKIATKSALVNESLPGGVGMQNTQRRLELLYKNRYQFTTRVLPATNEFELELELEL